MTYTNYFKLNQNAKVIAIFAESTLAGDALEDLVEVKQIVITDPESLDKWLSLVDKLSSKYYKISTELLQLDNSYAEGAAKIAEEAGDMFLSMFDMMLNLK